MKRWFSCYRVADSAKTNKVMWSVRCHVCKANGADHTADSSSHHALQTICLWGYSMKTSVSSVHINLNCLIIPHAFGEKIKPKTKVCYNFF